jgi:hypothetical protein
MGARRGDSRNDPTWRSHRPARRRVLLEAASSVPHDHLGCLCAPRGHRGDRRWLWVRVISSQPGRHLGQPRNHLVRNRRFVGPVCLVHCSPPMGSLPHHQPTDCVAGRGLHPAWDYQPHKPSRAPRSLAGSAEADGEGLQAIQQADGTPAEFLQGPRTGHTPGRLAGSSGSLTSA